LQLVLPTTAAQFTPTGVPAAMFRPRRVNNESRVPLEPAVCTELQHWMGPVSQLLVGVLDGDPRLAPYAGVARFAGHWVADHGPYAGR